MNCPRCQTANPEGARFCLNCAAPLEAPRPIKGERRFVMVLFADVVGSTRMGVPTEAPSILAKAAPQLPVDGRGRCPQRLYSGMYPAARPQRTLQQSSPVGNRRTVGQADRSLKGLA